ncbi:MAG: hypothetical protein ACYTG0_30955 [Planctomycetota bacterium]
MTLDVIPFTRGQSRRLTFDDMKRELRASNCRDIKLSGLFHHIALMSLVALWPTTGSAEKIVDTALFQTRVLCVNDDGTLSAWFTETGKPDRKLARVLSSWPISRVASDGSALWALSGTGLLKFSAAKDTWLEHSSLGAEPEAAIDLLSLGSEPVVVYPNKVVRPLVSRSYAVPRPDGFPGVYRLRVLTQHVSAHRIYFGTGRGEWGGRLVLLNTKSGVWSFHRDSLHYPTGITQASSDELIVTWSMSHFTADTLVRVHHLDTTVKHEYPKLELKYFQSIAYDSARKILYAIERNEVVRLKQGIPRRIADLGRLPYESEPDAIGVAPGVLALLPLPDASLLIIHRSSPPMALRKGKLHRFSKMGI